MQIIKDVKFDKLYYLEVCNPKGKRYITSKSIIDKTTSGTKITDFTDAFLFTNYSAAHAFAYKHVKSNHLINPQPIPEEVMEKIKKSGLKEYTLDAFEIAYMINKEAK